MTLLNFEDVVKLLIIKYPTLFWTKSEGFSVKNISNYIFNVIGNGYNTKESLVEFEDNKVNKLLLENKKYDFLFSGVQIYEVLNYSEIKLLIKQPDSIEGKFVSEDEKRENLNNEKEIIYSKIESRDSPYYPNFDKNFSFFYNMKNNKLLGLFNMTWLVAMKDFYENVRFDVNGSNAFPGKPSIKHNDEWLSFRNQIEKKIISMKKGRSDIDWYKEVSDYYKHPFFGDITDFLNTRWEKEKIRVNKFVEQILIDIEDEMKNRLEKEEKRKLKAII